jgi:methionyl-tRNA formyltransferase
MKFGQIDHLVVFGGGQRLLNLIDVSGGFRISIFTADRLLESGVGQCGETLVEELRKRDVDFRSVGNINATDLSQVVTLETMGISLGAPWIFTRKTIEQFEGRFVNGHGAKLPQNRGGGDYSWQIMMGENFGYHLFHLVEEGIDTGKIIYFDEFLFPPSCRTPKEYKDHFVESEIPFFRDFLAKVKAGYEFSEAVQQEYFSSYFPRLSTLHHGFVNWGWRAREIERFICAFDEPYRGASTFFEGKRVFLRKARSDTNNGVFHPFMNGLVFRKSESLIYVAVSDGAILIGEIQDEEGRDIIRKIRAGHRLVTPSKYLDDASNFRAIYDSKGLVDKTLKETKRDY